MVHNYKEDIEKTGIEIGQAIKNTETGQWESFVKYKGGDLLFSTPRLKKVEDFLVFKISHKKRFLEFLEDVEVKMIETIFDNSKSLFKGKKFTLEKIKNSLTPGIEIDDKGVVYLYTSNSKNLKCFNTFSDEIPIEKVKEDVSSVVKLEKITFNKDLYTLNYVITHLKMTKIEKPENISFNTDQIKEIFSNEQEEEKTEGDFFE